MTTAQTSEQPRRRGRPPGSKNKTADEKAAAKAATKADAKTTEHDRIQVEDLNDEQHFALMMQHARKISVVEGQLEKIKKDVKAARDLARSELGKGALHEIKLYRELESEEGQEKLRAVADMQLRIARWAGMPTGHMDDLFPAEDRTPIEDKAYAEGKRAGLAGEDNSAPHHYDGPLKSRWQAGYNDGQAVVAKGFKTLPVSSEAFGVPPEDKADAGDAKTYLASLKDLPDSTDWRAVGARGFLLRVNGNVPDGVPDAHREDWLEGWDKANVAYTKRKDAEKRDAERAAAA